jgi:hypothetical protein
MVLARALPVEASRSPGLADGATPLAAADVLVIAPPVPGAAAVTAPALKPLAGT